MSGCHDVTIGAKLSYQPADFIFHVVRRSLCQGVLGIYSTVEAEIFAEFLFQADRLHVGRSSLDRVQHVDSGLDHVRDDVINGAAAVVISLYAIGCRQIIMALQTWHKMFSYQIW